MSFNDLKSKGYYRFISVVYVGFFLIGFLFLVYSTFDSVGDHQTDFEVKCYFGNVSKFFAYQDKNILVNRYAKVNNPEKWSSNEAPDDWSVMDVATKGCGLSSVTAKSALDENINIFDVSLKKVNVHSYKNAIFDSIIVLVLLVLFFELIKRIFYFVVIGKFFPDKE